MQGNDWNQEWFGGLFAPGRELEYPAGRHGGLAE
jgi:hypothetical protein